MSGTWKRGQHMSNVPASRVKSHVHPSADGEFLRSVGVQVDHVVGDEVPTQLNGNRQTFSPWGIAHATAETILASISDGFFALDAYGRFTYVNPQAERLFQHSAREVLGRVIGDVLSDAMRPVVQGLYERARIDGVAVSFEEYCPGHQCWIAGRAYPTQTGGLGVYFRDVTKEKRTEMALQESEERFRVTFEQAPVGIAHVAPDGRWLRVNQRLCEILGYSRDALLAQTFQETTYLADLELDLEQTELTLRGEIQSYEVEKRFLRRDGQLVWCHLTISLVRDLDLTPKYFIAVIEDISARKDADGILGATAHELRLPVSHVKGFVSSLRRTDIDWQADVRRDFLAEIERETDRLSDLIENLLDRARSSRGDVPRPRRTTVTFAALVAGAVRRVQPELGSRTLEVDVAADLPRLDVDVTAIERVLANLLHNACKYSPPDSPICVSAFVVGRMLEFRVDDEGPGVPAEDRERIFEPFFRSAAGNRSGPPGHGLGLPICRSIVAAHDGHIWVNQRPGGGARFIVALPVTTRGDVPATQ
jgi:PAS domain S-box-containing protein